MWAQTLNTAPQMVGSGNQARDHAAGPDSAVVSSTGAALSPNTIPWAVGWGMARELRTFQGELLLANWGQPSVHLGPPPSQALSVFTR